MLQHGRSFQPLMILSSLVIATGFALPTPAQAQSTDVSAQTRVNIGFGSSRCNGDFGACDGTMMFNLGAARHITDNLLLSAQTVTGGQFFGGEYDTYALHLEYQFATQPRSTMFVAAGPHYYQLEDTRLFVRDAPTRSGVGASTELGWRRLTAQGERGFGADALLFLGTVSGSSTVYGAMVRVNYNF